MTHTPRSRAIHLNDEIHLLELSASNDRLAFGLANPHLCLAHPVSLVSGSFARFHTGRLRKQPNCRLLAPLFVELKASR